MTQILFAKKFQILFAKKFKEFEAALFEILRLKVLNE